MNLLERCRSPFGRLAMRQQQSHPVKPSNHVDSQFIGSRRMKQTRLVIIIPPSKSETTTNLYTFNHRWSVTTTPVCQPPTKPDTCTDPNSSIAPVLYGWAQPIAISHPWFVFVGLY